jgi:hypothetical protein
MEVELGSDGPDFPMLDIEKAKNRGNQFLRDHHSSWFVKLAIATIPAMILMYFIAIGFYFLAILLFSAIHGLAR